MSIWIPPKTFGQLSVGPGFGGTVYGPYLAALPVLPRLGAPVGSGGAVGCRDGACVVVGVEGSGGAVGSRDGAWVLVVLVSAFCGFWFHLCHRLWSAAEVVTPEMGPYLNHLWTSLSLLPLASLL